MTDRHLRLKCSTGQFDAVVAISEDMLNDQLREDYKRVKKFQKIEKQARGFTLDADLAPPRVTIPQKGAECEIYYHAMFGTATLKGSDGTPCSLNNSDLAFKVDIGR